MVAVEAGFPTSSYSRHITYCWIMITLIHISTSFHLLFLLWIQLRKNVNKKLSLLPLPPPCTKRTTRKRQQQQRETLFNLFKMRSLSLSPVVAAFPSAFNASLSPIFYSNSSNNSKSFPLRNSSNTFQTKRTIHFYFVSLLFVCSLCCSLLYVHCRVFIIVVVVWLSVQHLLIRRLLFNELKLS